MSLFQHFSESNRFFSLQICFLSGTLVEINVLPKAFLETWRAKFLLLQQIRVMTMPDFCKPPLVTESLSLPVR